MRRNISGARQIYPVSFRDKKKEYIQTPNSFSISQLYMNHVYIMHTAVKKRRNRLKIVTGRQQDKTFEPKQVLFACSQ